VFSISGQDAVNESGNTIIAYAFHSVTGYSKIGSFVGTGAAGNSITTGFKPAFVMWKSSTANTNWTIADNTRDTSNPITKRLIPNLNNAEDSSISVDFNDTGFEFNSGQANDNGETFIYMAFADTRNAAFWKDTSGQGNDWQPNNLEFSDVVPDSPTNNWCVWSPLTADSSAQFKEGNLEAAAADNRGVMASFNMPSGKWYWEVRKDANSTLIGIAPDTLGTEDVPNSSGENGVFYYFDGRVFQNGSSLGNYGSFTDGDIIGMTFDSSNREIKFYKNNSLAHTVTAAAGFTYAPAISAGSADAFVQGNFGQDSTFAGNTTAGGNADENGVGDFKYAPPSGFLSLFSANLPSGAVDTLDDETPEDYFNTVLYTGTSATRSVTGFGHSPDWLWTKARSNASNHSIVDVVRGTNKLLLTDVTDAEYTQAIIDSFDSDGFTTSSTGSSINLSGYTYAAWGWKAGGTAVSNTDGSITSQVSANTDAGFSVAGYTGNNTSGSTIGHGLTSAPEMIIVKNRSQADKWAVYHASNTSAPETDYLVLNDSVATADATYWADTAPTSTVFSVGLTGPINQPSEDYIAYCFHSVEGYSKIGSYTGNGSTDGTFVHCGFRPSLVMTKRTNTTGNWQIHDAVRDIDNEVEARLYPNVSNAEITADFADFTANGFKLRNSGSDTNASGSTYIFLAFASAPFKNANAR